VSKLKISIVVLTYNEAINIERCLKSVSWSDDVLVIDSGSTDGTCEMAIKLGARVIFRAFDNFANQRNFALDQGQLINDWVLHIDADEVVSQELKSELNVIIDKGDCMAAYRVPSKLMLMGQWLKYSGMYPLYQVRFGSREKLRFHMVGHGQREILDSNMVGNLKGHLVHFNFSKGISEWLAKHARYARDEAVTSIENAGSYRWRDLFFAKNPMERRRILKGLSYSLPMRPLLRFIYIYFFRKGFLDGRGGLRYALLIATYQWAIDMNMIEKEAD